MSYTHKCAECQLNVYSGMGRVNRQKHKGVKEKPLSPAYVLQSISWTFKNGVVNTVGFALPAPMEWFTIFHCHVVRRYTQAIRGGASALRAMEPYFKIFTVGAPRNSVRQVWVHPLVQGQNIRTTQKQKQKRSFFLNLYLRQRHKCQYRIFD